MTMTIITPKRYAAQATLALALLCATSTAAYAAPEIKQNEEVKLAEAKITVGDTTGGNAWVYEREDIWKQGIITGVQVCSGDAVNRIRVFYDGRPGTQFGGPGGTCADIWKVPPKEYIQGVRVWSGAWMNKIQFITSGGQTSPAWGGPGGNENEHYSNTGGALRVIDGKSGSYINGLKLGFGYPYKVENFQYTGKPTEVPLPLKQLVSQTVDGCAASSGDTSSALGSKETVEDEHTFSIGASATIGISTTLEAGIPDVASVGVTTSASLSVNLSESRTHRTTVEFSVDTPAAAEPGTKAEVTTRVKQARVTVPFTYDVVHYRNSEDNEVSRRTYSGNYKGVRALSVETIRTSYDCKTGKPMTEAQLEALRNPMPDTRQPTVVPPTRRPAPDPAPRPVNVPTPGPDYTDYADDAFDDTSYDDTGYDDTGYDAPSTSGTLTETLSFAMVSNGGMFDKVESGVWEEISADGGTFTYDVIDRDADCIYLLDRNRGVLIVIDVTRNKIGYAPNQTTEPYDLYDIVERG